MGYISRIYMADKIFKEITIKDPKTGKLKVLTPEDQEALLEAGIFIPPEIIVDNTSNQ